MNYNSHQINLLMPNTDERTILFDLGGRVVNISDSALRIFTDSLHHSSAIVDEDFVTDKYQQNIANKFSEIHNKVMVKKQTIEYLYVIGSSPEKTILVFEHQPLLDSRDQVVGSYALIYTPDEFWALFDLHHEYRLESREIIILLLLSAGIKASLIAKAFQISVLVIQHLKNIVLSKLGLDRLKIKVLERINWEKLQQGSLFFLNEHKLGGIVS